MIEFEEDHHEVMSFWMRRVPSQLSIKKIAKPLKHGI
jgi:sRNA-binding protein